jgi:hypothetical protein
MSDSTERLEQGGGSVSALNERLATSRPLQLLIAAVALVTAAVVGYAAVNEAGVTGTEGSEPLPVATADPADAPEGPVAAGEREPAPVATADPEGAAGQPVGALPPVDVRSHAEARGAASSTAPQDAPARSAADPAPPRGCPQPGVPGRDFPATEWQSSDDLYAHVHPEQWYISAWCAADAVAQSLGADGWRVRNWSDSLAVAVIVKSGLGDDSVFAVEYEARVVRTGRGWYVDPEQTTARYWCSRGVDVSEPSRCV